MGFENPVLGGTMLIRNAAQSQNFVTGVSGWSIFRNGNAEFNSATIRGQLVIGAPPGAGGSIGPTIPADLAAFYAGHLVSLANFAILAYPGDGSYFFEVVGTQLGVDVVAYGWSDGLGTGNIREVYSYTFQNPAGAGEVFYFGGNRSPQATATAYKFGSYTVAGGPSAFISFNNSVIVHGTGLAGDPSFYQGLAPFLLESTAPIGWNDGTGTFALSMDPVGGVSPVIPGMTNRASFNEVPQNYTPAMTNGGAVTFSVAKGYYFRYADVIFFAAQFTVNVAGTGAAALAVTAPTNIDRTIRQQSMVECEGTTAAYLGGGNVAVALTSGSANSFDRIRNDAGVNMTGADLLAGATISYMGWYREA